MSAASPFRLTSKGIEIYIKLTPNAAFDAVDGLRSRSYEGDSDPGPSKQKPSSAAASAVVVVAAEAELEVKVTAPPDKGKANSALVKLLAKEWKVGSSELSVASGATSRNKRLLLTTRSGQDGTEKWEKLCGWLLRQEFKLDG